MRGLRTSYETTCLGWDEGVMSVGLFGVPLDAGVVTFNQFEGLLDQAIEQRGAADGFHARYSRDPRFLELNGKTLNTGGGARLHQPEHYPAWWVWRANRFGIERAHAEMDAFLDASAVTVLYTLGLYGLRVDAPVTLTDRVSLVSTTRLPFSRHSHWVSQESSPFSMEHVHGAVLPAATLVFESEEPKFAAIGETAGGHFFEAQRQLHEICLLLNALSGVCSFPATHSAYLGDHVPPGPFAGEHMGGADRDVVIRAESRFPADGTALLRDLVRAYSAKPDDEKQRLTRALYRLAQGKGRSNPHDRALDVGIALEMLLLNDSPPEQLSLTFRLRGAWLLGKTKEERERAYKTLSRIYTLRSKVAHEGYAKDLRDSWSDDAKADAAERDRLAEDIFRRLILGAKPDWRTLVLGDT